MSLNKTITIKDVATKANVSVGTVSRVLNNAKNINPDNIKRVNEAVKDLGYRKCSAAQLLGSKKNHSKIRTGNIGFVFAELTSVWQGHPHLEHYSKAVEKACREHGCHAIIEWADNTKQGELPTCVLEGKVDGVIVMGTNVDYSKYGNLPLVGISKTSAEIQCVVPDDRSAGRTVAEYLWNKGHRRISYMCNSSSNMMFISRFHGYKEFLEQMQSFDPDLVKMYNEHIQFDQPQTSFPDMTLPLKELLDLPESKRPTAIITANDWTAAGLYAAFRQQEVSVAEQISVVGFDNLEALCCSLFPALTSYAIPFKQVAYTAAQKLFAQLENPPDENISSTELIKGKIVERESVRTIKS
ncbi:MAG: LacI family DNA-binding transcriptional regulator [Kiritimatiellae bacterium]|jgi:LacI family transcriptional regulator|nr:LacI family DNA-binding transcriptional regulator [Kiritimatiellia bacterium]